MIILLSIFGTLVLVLAVLHFVNGKVMHIEQSKIIAQPSKVIFDYLKITKNQDNFSVWNMADPGMKKTYTGTDGEAGFVYKWDSTNKNVGEGEQEILKIEGEKRIEYVVRFKRPMQNVAKVHFEIEPLGTNSTQVKWVFNSPTKFPMSVLKSVFVKMLGKDLQSGLNNLKTLMEKNHSKQ